MNCEFFVQGEGGGANPCTNPYMSLEVKKSMQILSCNRAAPLQWESPTST